MFDARIAVEEFSADLTAVEIAELNAWRDECDTRDAEREEREELYCIISEISKEVNGTRFRFDYMNIPLADLRQEYHSWCLYAEMVREDEAEREWEEELYAEEEVLHPTEWDLLCDHKGW